MYGANITRENKTLFVLLIDQSGSMDEKIAINGQTTTKAGFVASVANSMIAELINRCRREEGIRDYFQIAAIGYSDNRIRPLLGESYALLAPSVLASMDVPRRTTMEERRLANGETTIGCFEETLWIQSYAAGNTPMYEALLKAHGIVSHWTSSARNRASFPPVVINISDGEATDADQGQLVDLARNIKALSTDDGQTLLINIHITGDPSLQRTLFPASITELPNDRNARALYEMSSEMPEIYNEQILAARDAGAARAPFRGISYNTPVTELVAMMNIGSVSVSMMV